MQISTKNTLLNKAVAYLLIINLVSSILAPTLASAMESENRFLLCTSQGYQWVTIETEQEFRLSNDASEHCIYCLSSKDDQEQAVFILNYLELVPAEYLFIQNNDFVMASEDYFVTSQPRAPPLFI